MTIAHVGSSQVMGAPSPQKGVVQIADDVFVKMRRIFEELRLGEIYIAVSSKNPFDQAARKLFHFTATNAEYDAENEMFTIDLSPKTRSFFAFTMHGYTSKIYIEGKEGEDKIPLGFETVFHSNPKADHAVIKSVSGNATLVCDYISEEDVKALYSEAPANIYKPAIEEAGMDEFAKKQALTYRLSLFAIRSLKLTLRNV